MSAPVSEFVKIDPVAQGPLLFNKQRYPLAATLNPAFS
jgi:hypothetical protein